MDRDLLKKRAVRFLPVSFISMGAAILVCGLVGMITGRGFGEAILYIALPMMSGGMGAGVVPLSGIYASALGTDSAFDCINNDSGICHWQCPCYHHSCYAGKTRLIQAISERKR